ncbi:MAG: hypothetical protein ACRECF_03660 [Methyloceanibacter sp.]
MARRSKPQDQPYAPGETVDMTKQEAFDRVFSLARIYAGLPGNVATDRDRMAIDLLTALAVGSHSYKPKQPEGVPA